MGYLVDYTARLLAAGRQAYARKWSFLALFVLAFFGSIAALRAGGLLPDAHAVPAATAPVTVQAPAPAAPELPARIEIPAISLAASIANPTTTVIEKLDEALLRGAVRYPTSAKLGENGNVVLFGHSSYLPVVNNQAYKTFNGIQKLAAGDEIRVYSADAVYTYRVRSVAQMSANDAGIPLSVNGRVLTLSTCDSFGEKSDRFVVTADFVESRAISG